jgi:acetoacetyl-CoA synthetase
MTLPQWRRFAAASAERHGAPTGGDYAQVWQWSVDDPARFWRALWEYFGLHGGDALGADEAAVLSGPSMPGAQWFRGIELNYVDRILSYADRDGAAIVGIDESGARTEISWRELPGQVGAVAAELRRLGVGRGDAVVAYLPDVAEAMIASLAVASLGAIWS